MKPLVYVPDATDIQRRRHAFWGVRAQRRTRLGGGTARSRCAVWLGGGLWLLVEGWARPAAAQSTNTASYGVEETVPLGVAYRAESSHCPSADAFAFELEKRVIARPPRESAQFSVALTSSPVSAEDGFVGVMTLVRPGQPDVTRRVGGADCSEVASAMAIIVALAMDAVVENRPLPPEPEPAAKPEPGAASGEAMVQLPASETEAEPDQKLLELALEPYVEREETPARAPSEVAAGDSPVDVSFGAIGGADYVLATPAFGGHAFLSAEWPYVALRLGAGYRGRAHADVGEQNYRLDVFGGRAELCTPTLGSGAFGGQACGAIELARLQARAGDGFRRAEPGQHSVWAAGGAIMRPSYRLSATLYAELEGAVLVPISRDLRLTARATDGATQELYRPPTLGLWLGIGMRWSPWSD